MRIAPEPSLLSGGGGFEATGGTKIGLKHWSGMQHGARKPVLTGEEIQVICWCPL